MEFESPESSTFFDMPRAPFLLMQVGQLAQSTHGRWVSTQRLCNLALVEMDEFKSCDWSKMRTT